MTTSNELSFIERQFPQVVPYFTELRAENVDFTVVRAEGERSNTGRSITVTVEFTKLGCRQTEAITFVETREERQLAAEFNRLGFPNPSQKQANIPKTCISVVPLAISSICPTTSQKQANIPKTCIGCMFYHGKQKVVCAVHPNGVTEENCPDWSEQ